LAVGNAKRFRLESDEEHAPVIERMFREYAHGKSVPGIAKKFNDDGLRAEGGKRWTAKRVYFILSNRTYCGDIVAGRSDDMLEEPIVFEGVHPAVVDRETFARVQEIRNRRSRDRSARRREGSPYLLSGLVICGRCGRHLVGTSAKSGQYRYYTCQQYYHEGKEACLGIRIGKRDLESFIVSKTRDLILDDDNLRSLVSLVNEELEERTDRISEQLERLDEGENRLQQRLARHYEALETGALELQDVAARIQALRAEIMELERQKAHLGCETASQKCREVDLESVLAYAENLRRTLRIGNIDRRREFLRSLIEQIEVGPESIEIQYRLPVPEEETEEMLSPVLTGVTLGGAGVNDWRTFVLSSSWA